MARDAGTSAPAAAPEVRPVDVIIPVYRGLEETRRCVESALATVVAPHRVVIIDDHSPEPEVTRWLEQTAAARPDLQLLRNDRNLGFVGTVNRGMRLAPERDVILLNSDTEVSGDWVGRMQAAAYDDPAVATVTPFSNNATICSWPRFCRDNELPPGVTREQLDSAFAAANAGTVVDIPTGVGFAMYIRRDALDTLGLFDEEAFGKGYGEENDFCRRAAKAGWRNVLLADTFVYHAGSVSFGVDQQRLDAATKALLRKHPDYLRKVGDHIRTDPARVHRWRAALSVLRHSGLPVILSVVHRRGGGTLVHVEELAERLRGRAWMLVLAQGDWNAVDLALPETLGGDALPFDPHQEWDDLVALLRYVDIDRIHIHHLLDMPDRLLDLPDTLSVPFDFTAHDFYVGCPRITLSGTRHAYCGQPDPAGCNACLAQAPRAQVTDITAWRNGMTARLAAADRLLAPHRDAARRLKSMVPDLTFRPVPHPDAAALAAAPPPTAPAPAADQRLRVVILGALSRIKGAELVEAAALEAERRNLPVEFHLLGYAYRGLKKAGGRLVVHGRYEHAEIDRHLARIDPHVAWLPARSPETYSYTLSEVIGAGLPVVVSDLGAPPDRIAGRPMSWVLPWDISPTGAADFFAGLARELPPSAPASDLPPLAADYYPDTYLAEAGLAASRRERPQAAPTEDVARALAQAAAKVARRQALQGIAGLRRRLWDLAVRSSAHPVFAGLVRRIPLSARDRLQRLIKG